MGLIVFTVLASVVNASPSMAMDAAERDSGCLVALQAERNLGPLSDRAKDYFEKRVRLDRDVEAVERLMRSAKAVMLTNTNRREIASNCVLLYQVLALQENTKRPTASQTANEAP